MAASKRLYEALAESIGMELGYQRAHEVDGEIRGRLAVEALLDRICLDLRADNFRFDSERFRKAVEVQAGRTQIAYAKIEAN